MNQHIQSDQDSDASTVFDSDRGLPNRRRSQRLQGLQPGPIPDIQSQGITNASIAPHQATAQFVSPAEQPPQPRHQHRSPPESEVETSTVSQDHSGPNQIQERPQPQPEEQQHQLPVHPPHQPVAEIHVNQAGPPREYRRIPRQIFPAGNSIQGGHNSVATSNHTPPQPLPLMYQQPQQDPHRFPGYDAAQYNQHPFIDDRSLPDQKRK